MIDLNTQEADNQINVAIKGIELNSTSVKIYKDRKVVAEIVPVNERTFVPNLSVDIEDGLYETMGETLAKL